MIDFESLLDDLKDMKGWIEYWPIYSQYEVNKRHLKELCPSVGWVLQNWEQVVGVVYAWPLPGDNPNTKRVPTNPMNRFSNGSPEQKMNLFLELMTEHVIAPLERTAKRVATSCL